MTTQFHFKWPQETWRDEGSHDAATFSIFSSYFSQSKDTLRCFYRALYWPFYNSHAQSKYFETHYGLYLFMPILPVCWNTLYTKLCLYLPMFQLCKHSDTRIRMQLKVKAKSTCTKFWSGHDRRSDLSIKLVWSCYKFSTANPHWYMQAPHHDTLIHICHHTPRIPIHCHHNDKPPH